MPAKTSKPVRKVPTSLSALHDNMVKRYGGQRVVLREDVGSIKATSTGSLSLDLALRVGGWAEGRIHEIVGSEGVSKTTLCINSAREAQIAYPDKAVGFIDMEQTFDWGWAERNGLDTSRDRFMYVLPDNSEDVADQAQMMIETGLFKMIILDSIGGMESKQALDKDAGEHVMGRNAQVITRLSKRLAVMASRHQCTVLVVNQPRANIANPMGQDVSAGPKAFKHATTTKVQISRTGEPPRRVKYDGDPDPETVGTQFRARVPRNKVAAAGKTATYWLNNQVSEEYGPIGIDRACEAVDIGILTRVIKQEPGGYYSMPWTTDKKDRIRGREAVQDYLREHLDRLSEIRDAAVRTMSGDVLTHTEDVVVEQEDED